MSPTQTLTRKDLYSQIQEIVFSDLTWEKLTSTQKTLFANPLLLVSLNVNSNEEAFYLIKSQPDILSPKDKEIDFETGSTVDAALLEDLVNQMNQDEVDSEIKTGLSKYSFDQRKLIEKMVNIRREEIRLEKILENKQALEQIKPQVNKLDAKQNPRQNLIKTSQNVITTAIKTSPVDFTPSQKTAAVKAFVATSLSGLDLNNPENLSLAISTSLAVNPNFGKNNPVIETYHQIEKAITFAKEVDYQQAILESGFTKIIDPQSNIVIDLSKLPQPDKIDLPAITQSNQQTISKLLENSPHEDITDISDSLTTEVKKLHAIGDNQQAREISHALIVQLSDQQLDKLTHVINQVDPTVLQQPTQPGQKAAAILNETSPKNTLLSPQTVKLYSQGLTSKTWLNVYTNEKIQKLIPPQQAYVINQQLKSLDNSKLGKEITQPLGKLGRSFQTFTNKISGKLPQLFTKPLNYIFHPFQSIKGYIGKRIGSYLGRKIYKAFAKRVTNKAARLIAKTLLREGAKQAVGALIKLGAKTAIKLGLEAGLIAGGVTAPVGLILLALDAVVFVAKKIIGGIQNIAQSIFGEKIKARDLLALPVAAAASFAAILAGLGAATVVAASSAAGIVGLSAAAGLFLYITAFTVAPLISTIAQLESQPGAEYHIAPPTGPIPPGCPSGWPTSSGIITQGPRTSSTHYGAEAIDVGVGMGTPVYSTHPGRAIAIGSSGPYGNYVDVYGICNGINYVTRYAHMPSVPFFGELLVNSGDQIGVVNNTGNSTGNHLHYEIRGSALGDINQFLPKPVRPGCIEYSQCQVTIP